MTESKVLNNKTSSATDSLLNIHERQLKTQRKLRCNESDEDLDLMEVELQSAGGGGAGGARRWRAVACRQTEVTEGPPRV